MGENSYTNIYGMEERWGLSETEDSYGGHLGATNLDGNQILELTIPLKDFADGVTYVFDKLKVPAGAMVMRTVRYVVKGGVGGTAVDIGGRGKTINDQTGFVGGCPVSNEGDRDEHEDDSGYNLIGTVLTEPVRVTITPSGQFTAGEIVFRIIYRANVDYKEQNVLTPEWTTFKPWKEVS